MNITDVSAKRNCTSCQMCAAICPKNAISIALDLNGFYRPRVDDSLCVDCGICMKVCYRFEQHNITININKKCSTILGDFNLVV